MLFNAFPNLDTRLEHAVVGEQEARAALTLIDDSSSEVISVEVFPIPLWLEIIEAKLIKGRLYELLGMLESLLEFTRAISKRLLRRSALLGRPVAMLRVRTGLGEDLCSLKAWVNVGICGPTHVRAVHKLRKVDALFIRCTAELSTRMSMDLRISISISLGEDER